MKKILVPDFIFNEEVKNNILLRLSNNCPDILKNQVISDNLLFNMALADHLDLIRQENEKSVRS